MDGALCIPKLLSGSDYRPQHQPDRVVVMELDVCASGSIRNTEGKTNIVVARRKVYAQDGRFLLRIDDFVKTS